MKSRGRYGHEIVADLRQHLEGGGKLTDETSDRLYREWFQVREDVEVDPDRVERWAVRMRGERQ